MTTAALALGCFACTSSPLPLDEGGDDTQAETDGTTNGNSNSTEDGWSECDGDCPDGYTCVDDQCVPPDVGPCECAIDEICIDEVCVAVEQLPACAPLEVTTTETFGFAGADADLVIGEFDQNPGADLVGVSLDKAITWHDGNISVWPLEFPGGTSLQIAALHTNDDGHLDIAVTIPSVHILYQIVGDGAGGFANDKQRNFGGNPPWDVERVRTAPGVDGMIVRVSLDGASEQWMFFDAATSVGADQILNGYMDRWPGDLDDDGVDELIIHQQDQTSLWARTGDSYGAVVELPVSVEPLPSTARCSGFAIADLDNDADNDIVCIAPHLADVGDYAVLVPLFNAGALSFERGEPVVVGSKAESLRVFDLDGDGSSELLLDDLIVDLGPEGSFECALAHELSIVDVGDVDGDGADEIASFGAETMVLIHDLSW